MRRDPRDWILAAVAYSMVAVIVGFLAAPIWV